MQKALKWIVLALSLSLMANVFAAGYWMGDRGNPPGPQPGGLDGPGGAGEGSSKAGPRVFIGALPPHARRVFVQALREKSADMRQERRTLREKRKAISDTIGAGDSLDVGALRSAFAAAQQSTALSQQYFEEALIAALETMSAQERQAFSERLEQLTQKGRERAQTLRERVRERRGQLRERRLGRPPPDGPLQENQPPEF